MDVLKYVGLSFLALIIIATFFLIYRFVSYGEESRSMTPKLGLYNGQLADCPETPNCVSSYSIDKQHAIEAIHGGHGTIALIASYVHTWEGASLVTETENYLHVEVRSSLFGFVDDIEFYFDGSLIQVRSASRVGHSDLNANRKRVEMIREMVSGRY